MRNSDSRSIGSPRSSSRMRTNRASVIVAWANPGSPVTSGYGHISQPALHRVVVWIWTFSGSAGTSARARSNSSCARAGSRIAAR